jgi:hypothetical protein
MESRSRPSLHPILRALLRVATAPDSALRRALGNYAVTFVQWHLWAAVRYNLIPGTKVREIWSREAWRGATEWPANATTPFVRLAMVFCNHLFAVPHLAPDGRLIMGFCEKNDRWVVRVWDAPSLEWWEEVHTPRPAGQGEIVSRLGPGHRPDGTVIYVEPTHLAVARETNELFAGFHSFAPPFDPGVICGLFGQPDAEGHARRITGFAGFRVHLDASFGCDRFGRRLYLMAVSPAPPPISKIIAVSTRSWSIEHDWEVPYATDMVVTDTEHIILAHWTGAISPAPQVGRGDRWIGVYSRRGELVRRWEVECTPTRCWTPRKLRYDPRTNQLALFLDLNGETAVYIYA